MFTRLTLVLALFVSLLAEAGPPKKRPSEAERKAFAHALSLGRKAAKAKDYAGALAALEAALKLSPRSPSVLGELGWAHFNAGQLDKAAAHTESAIDTASRAKQLGALHYNRGRILEAQGKKEEARVAYTESLGLRANETVRKRVDGLGGPLVRSTTAAAAATADKAAVEVVSYYCESCDGTADEGCTCGGAPTEIGEGGIESFEVVHIEGSGEPGGSVDTHVLVVGHGGRFFGMGVVADGYTPGVAYIYNSGSVDAVRVEDLLPELPGKELVIEATNGTVDHDPGVESTSSDEKKTWMICGLAKGRPTCATLTRAVDWSNNELGPDWEVGKELDSGKWSLDVSVSGGKISVALGKGTREGDLPPATQACLGTFTFAGLSERACVDTVVAE